MRGIAGSLSERKQIVRWPAPRAARLGGLLLLGGLALAAWSVPHTWQRKLNREEQALQLLTQLKAFRPDDALMPEIDAQIQFLQSLASAAKPTPR